MKPRSAKQKGRKFQQEVRDALLSTRPDLEPDDIRSNPMGAPGEDILFSPAARRIYPFSIECKHVERLNIHDAIQQANDNCRGHTPAVVFRKNGKPPYIAIPLDVFLEYFKDENEEI